MRRPIARKQRKAPQISAENRLFAQALQQKQRELGEPVQSIAEICGQQPKKGVQKQLDRGIISSRTSKPAIRYNFYGKNMSICHEFYEHTVEKLKQTDMTDNQRNQALSALWAIVMNIPYESFECGKNAKELAGFLGIQQSRMTETIKRLESIGAIRRIQRGRDKIICVNPEAAYMGKVSNHPEIVDEFSKTTALQ